MAKTRRRYFWAMHFGQADPEVRALSEKAREGLAYAKRLAVDASWRAKTMFEHDVPPAPLTVDDLTDMWTSKIQIHSAIKQARVELFGKDLSNSAIAYQLAKRRARKQPIRCAESGCNAILPRLAHASKRYCDGHGSSTARVERHRRAQLRDTLRG